MGNCWRSVRFDHTPTFVRDALVDDVPRVAQPLSKARCNSATSAPLYTKALESTSLGVSLDICGIVHSYLSPCCWRNTMNLRTLEEFSAQNPYRSMVDAGARAHVHDMVTKLVVVGAAATGKTTMVRRFAQGELPAAMYLPTIGIDFQIRNIRVDSRYIKSQIWDTAGNDRFRTITLAYYRGCHGVLLVFDVGNAATFEQLPQFAQEIKSHVADNTTVFVIGNVHSDNERQVSVDRAMEFAERYEWAYFEVNSCLEMDDFGSVMWPFAMMIGEVAARLQEHSMSFAKATGAEARGIK